MAAEAGSGDALAVLKQKVGPLPLGAWALIGLGVWWYLQKKQAASGTAANQQKDPAGNVGTIDAATGYVYGTPEDTAALAAQNSGTASTGTSSGSSATSGAQTYADNNTWGLAAVSYLQGLGISGTDATQAIQLYLGSQPLTSAQQGDVNLAIQALGPPPTLPGPTQGGSAGTTTPAAGQQYTVSIPNGQLGWETITFPSQSALDQFNTWLSTNPAAAKRSAINQEIQSLGGTGEIPQPSGPNTSYPSGTPQNTGNPLDYQ